MNTQALLLELLLSGFFAIACFKARVGNSGKIALSPREFLRLTDRMERLRRTRWQWFAMVLTIVLVRIQSGMPLAIELTTATTVSYFPVSSYAEATNRRNCGEQGSPAILITTNSGRVSNGKA